MNQPRMGEKAPKKNLKISLTTAQLNSVRRRTSRGPGILDSESASNIFFISKKASCVWLKLDVDQEVCHSTLWGACGRDAAIAPAWSFERTALLPGVGRLSSIGWSLKNWDLSSTISTISSILRRVRNCINIRKNGSDRHVLVFTASKIHVRRRLEPKVLGIA